MKIQLADQRVTRVRVWDGAGGALLSNLPPLHAPQPALPEEMANGDTIVAPTSRNAPCPCGSGLKYKHCHGQTA